MSNTSLRGCIGVVRRLKGGREKDASEGLLVRETISSLKGSDYSYLLTGPVLSSHSFAPQPTIVSFA